MSCLPWGILSTTCNRVAKWWKIEIRFSVSSYKFSMAHAKYLINVVVGARAIHLYTLHVILSYSISQEICTRFLLCYALLWLYIDFPISTRLTSLALWQSNDCPSASKATLMNMDKYLMWIHYERLHNHNKAKHNKTVCIFLGIYCSYAPGHRHVKGKCTLTFKIL